MISTCRSCGALILWARTEHGKRIPLDAAKVSHGNIDLDGATGIARVVMPSDEPRYLSHFATCPDAADHRKARVRQPSTERNP